MSGIKSDILNAMSEPRAFVSSPPLPNPTTVWWSAKILRDRLKRYSTDQIGDVLFDLEDLGEVESRKKSPMSGEEYSTRWWRLSES